MNRKKNKKLKEYVTKGKELKEAIEQTFIGENNRLIIPALEIAELAGWKNWKRIASRCINSSDPDIRIASISALAVLTPKTAFREIRDLLRDPVSRVIKKAALHLTQIGSEESLGILIDALSGEDIAGDQTTIYQGIAESGGKSIAQLILSNDENLTGKILGRILSEGLDEAGAFTLAEQCTTPASLKKDFKEAGTTVGPYLAKVWTQASSKGRKALSVWMDSCHWIDESVQILAGKDKNARNTVLATLTEIPVESRETLFSKALTAADASKRRRASRLLMKR